MHWCLYRNPLYLKRNCNAFFLGNWKLPKKRDVQDQGNSQLQHEPTFTFECYKIEVLRVLWLNIYLIAHMKLF